MPQAPHDQQDWFAPASSVLDRLVLCTRRLPTDAPLPEAEHEAAKVLRMTLANAALSMAVVVVGVVRAVLENVSPVAIGTGGCVIGLLAYLHSLSVPPEVARNLALIPTLGSHRLRLLRLSEMGINATTNTLLFAAGIGLLTKSILDLL